jgi:hypothetical protein
MPTASKFTEMETSLKDVNRHEVDARLISSAQMQLSYLLPLERDVWGAMERKVLDRRRSSLHQGLRLLVELAPGAYYRSGGQR